MVKVKLHSQYDHFPNHKPLPGEPFIDCYNDGKIHELIRPNSIALMIEPRSLQEENYIWMTKNYKRFKYVFTHDSQLLKSIPNAKLILWGGVWGNSRVMKDFKHPVSMVSSDKEMCPLHIARKKLALELLNKVDCYGTFNGGEFTDTATIYSKYPFSIAVENYIDDYWFTEKICNCFANYCIPIYYGARKIDEFFNPKGIIRVNDLSEVKYLVENLNAKQEYLSRADAVIDNYNRVKQFEDFETWFFNQYEELLSGMVQA